MVRGSGRPKILRRLSRTWVIEENVGDLESGRPKVLRRLRRMGVVEGSGMTKS